MNVNKTYIKGKYICPLFSFICPTTILCTVAYIDSWYADHALGITFPLLFEIRLRIKTIYPPSVKYNPIFVTDIDKSPRTGAFKLIKSLISN